MKNGVLSAGILLWTLVFHFKSGDSVMKGVDFFFHVALVAFKRMDTFLHASHILPYIWNAGADVPKLSLDDVEVGSLFLSCRIKFLTQGALDLL